MKRTFSVLAAFALLSFASCKKEDAKACYSCVLTSDMGMGSGMTTTATQEYCDKTQKEIDDIQNSGNTTVTSGPITMTTKMNCTKK